MKRTEELNVQIKFINDLTKLLNERYNNLNNSEKKEELKSLIILLTQAKLTKTLQKITEIKLKNQKKMTTIEQLTEIFNGWRDQLVDKYSTEINDSEKMWLQGRLNELNRIEDKLKTMLWAGQILIKFNV